MGRPRCAPPLGERTMIPAALTDVDTGRPIRDVVHWRDAARGCSRCAGAATRYIPPYFAPTKRVCPTCCRELNRLFDEHGWPDR
jgi:hypothetical protein